MLTLLLTNSFPKTAVLSSSKPHSGNPSSYPSTPE